MPTNIYFLIKNLGGCAGSAVSLQAFSLPVARGDDSVAAARRLLTVVTSLVKHRLQ